MKNWRSWTVALAVMTTAGVGAGWLAQAGLYGGYLPLRVAAALLTALLVLTDIKTVATTVWGNTAIVILLAWSGLSVLWSREPVETITSMIGLVSTALLAGVLAILGRRVQLEHLLLGIFTATSAVSLLFIAFLPGIATVVVDHPTEGRLIQPIGVFIWNSDLGFSAGLAAIIATSLWLRKRGSWWLIPIAALNVFAVWVSNSAASVIVLAAGIIALLLASGRVIALATVGFAAGAAILGGLFLGFSRFVDLLLSLVQRSTSLTGRTDLWRLALEQAASSPLWGQGFGLTPDYSGVSHANHAHNGFIQVYFDRGLVGVLIFLAIFVGAFLAAVRRKDRTGVALVVAVAVANLANDYLTFASLGLLVLLWQSFLGSSSRLGWLTSLTARLRDPATARASTRGDGQGPGG